ncbi:MAG: toll/interleukin-1 receptor domain-containing protein, partial [Methylocella sp.]
DNEPDPRGERWVTDFVKYLEVELRRRLCGTDELTVYFDLSSLRGNDHLKELLDSARKSAVFVAVHSRAYAARPWTRDELEAFSSVANEPGRLFALEILPLDEGENYLPQIESLNRPQFYWTNEPESRVPYPITPRQPPDDRYIRKLQDLAEHLRCQLRLMRDARSASASFKASAAEPSRAESAVLLAQVTDDLDEDREQVRRYLEQFSVPVIPERLYPQGGYDFAQAFRRDIRRARLFVQLVGPVGSRCPPDLPKSYAQFQYDTARAAGLPTLLWRRPDIDPVSVNNQDRALLFESGVVAMTFESFKAEILRLFRVTDAPKAPPPLASSDPSIFINADQSDLDLARELQQEFARNKCSAAIRMFGGQAAAVNNDLRGNIVDSDAIVLVYGKAQREWVRAQLRLYNKYKIERREPARMLAIYVCPPEPKEDIDMVVPEAREIDCRLAFTLNHVQQIVAELRA